MIFRQFTPLKAKFLINTMTESKLNDIAAIGDNLKFVKNVIDTTFAKKLENVKSCRSPRLVAVTKKQPKQAIIEAYKCDQRHFGENYVQELVDKASDQEILEKCPDIKWHFIGHLQRKSVNKLLTVVDKISVIETIDSEKIASCVNDALQKKKVEKPMSIFVQVNTSGEDNKSGVEPNDVITLVKFILNNCPLLEFSGLMTIGSFDCSTSDEPVNEEFKLLYDLKEKVCAEVEDLAQVDSFVKIQGIEVSMGMSGDYPQAILHGSTNVRVGSKLFGPRLTPE